MRNRFPIEFFQELVKKQMMQDEMEDLDITLVDDDNTEGEHPLEDTIPERIITLKF